MSGHRRIIAAAGVQLPRPPPQQPPRPRPTRTLRAERKSDKTIRTYTEAAQGLAAEQLRKQASHPDRDDLSRADVEQWMVWLLDRYSDSYSNNQYRALQQFFKWWAEDEDLPDPMAKTKPPTIDTKVVPVFTDDELAKLSKAREGRTFEQRRDFAIISLFKATGMRLSELAGINHCPHDPERNDLDLDLDLTKREARLRGKGGKERIARFGHETARAIDRYLRLRTKHRWAHRPQLWLGINNRPPMTANGIYQMIARRGQQCGVPVFPHKFRHHFSHIWLDNGGAEGDLMELNGWSSEQMLRRYGASARSPRPPQLRPDHGRSVIRMHARSASTAAPPSPATSPTPASSTATTCWSSRCCSATASACSATPTRTSRC